MRRTSLGAILLMLAVPLVARGDFASVIDVPPSAAPEVIGSETQLNLFDGGALPGFFEAGSFDGSATNVEVNVFGGTIDWEFRAYAGSTVNLFGGTVGDEFDAANGSVVNIRGGSMGGYFDAQAGSVVNISGGTIGERFSANAGSTVTISGGSFGSGDGLALLAAWDSLVTISGGTFDGTFRALSGSEVSLFGTEFLLNGSPIAGLNQVGDSVVLADRDGAVLHAVLRDGTVRDFVLDATPSVGAEGFAADATLQLTLATAVPEPAGMVLAAVGGGLVLVMGRWRRRRGTAHLG